jgi:hypothetical protein
VRTSPNVCLRTEKSLYEMFFPYIISAHKENAPIKQSEEKAAKEGKEKAGEEREIHRVKFASPLNRVISISLVAM